MNERRIFLRSETLYPREFSSNFSIMEVYKEKIEDLIKKNPLENNEKYYSFIKKEKGKVKEFKKIKRSVEYLLEEMKLYEINKDKKGKEYVDYLLLKQDLFLNLQKGEIKKVEKCIKTIESKIKTKS